MIDVNAHILPGIGDGSQNLNETMFILHQLKSLGFTDVVCTPFYDQNKFKNFNNITKNRILEIVRIACQNANINIRLHAGNEVVASNMVKKLIKTGEVQPINKGYVMMTIPDNAESTVIYRNIIDLQLDGYHIIVSHPETSETLQNNPEMFIKLREMGVEFQGNFDSILDKRYKKTFKEMLKNNYIDYLGSNIHSVDTTFFTNYPKMIKKITKIIGKNGINQIEQNSRILLSPNLFKNIFEISTQEIDNSKLFGKFEDLPLPRY